MNYRWVRWLAFGLALALAGLVLFVPWHSTVAPAVRLQVLDEVGNPAAGVSVKQRWGHYNFGSEKEASSRSDDKGYVQFPARSVKASIVVRAIKPMVGLFMHEGTGPYAQIHAFGTDPYVWTSVASSVKDPPPMQIQLKRRDVALYP